VSDSISVCYVSLMQTCSPTLTLTHTHAHTTTTITHTHKHKHTHIDTHGHSPTQDPPTPTPTHTHTHTHTCKRLNLGLAPSHYRHCCLLQVLQDGTTKVQILFLTLLSSPSFLLKQVAGLCHASKRVCKQQYKTE